jgi:UDP-N-acetylmuramoyl-tripeptide--D-alanyl-D-alanine ligase
MELYKLFQNYPEICTDTRNIVPNSIFFALRGDNFDANAFARKAVDEGCAYAVIDNSQYADDERFIVVDDVLKTLQELARFHRRQMKATVIGITGTNGKTTTKELIADVLKEKYNVIYTQGNLNNHIGVPLTLLKIKPEHEFAVIEMGANHAGEIRTLAEIAQPDYGIITNVGKAHLEGFGSFEGVMRTKAELYDFILKRGKGIFLNSDNENLMQMANSLVFTEKERSVIFYSLLDKADVRGKIIDCSPFLEMEIAMSQQFSVTTNLTGSYNAENVLAAVAIGNFFGVDAQHIKQGIENYKPTNNRSQFVETEKNKLIVDAYNANPTSMTAAINNFAQIAENNKTLIIGDMLELGEQSAEEHQKIVELLVSFGFVNVFLVGKNFSATKNNFRCFDNVEELENYFLNNTITDSYVLIKGSRGTKLETIIRTL